MIYCRRAGDRPRPPNDRRLPIATDLLARLFGHTASARLALAAADVTPATDGLFPEEAAQVADAVEKRRAEFATGRRLARQALAGCGGPSLAVGRGALGQPLWPEGYVGSISHGQGRAVAVAGSASDWAALGIDVEGASGIREGGARLILRDDEGDWPAALPLDAVKLAFSAKEAVGKALSPRLGIRFGFAALAIRVTCDEDGEGGAIVPHYHDPALIADPVAARLQARWCLSGPHVYCGAFAPA